MRHAAGSLDGEEGAGPGDVAPVMPHHMASLLVGSAFWGAAACGTPAEPLRFATPSWALNLAVASAEPAARLEFHARCAKLPSSGAVGAGACGSIAPGSAGAGAEPNGGAWAAAGGEHQEARRDVLRPAAAGIAPGGIGCAGWSCVAAGNRAAGNVDAPNVAIESGECAFGALATPRP